MAQIEIQDYLNYTTETREERIINCIFREDCLETLRGLEDNSIDLILTSPPFNKNWYTRHQKGKSDVWKRHIGYDEYADCMPPEEYEKWQREILNECMRVLKPTGSIFYNHKDILSKGRTNHPKWIYDYPLHQIIVQDRGSSPMLDRRYFFALTEYYFWITKKPTGFYFDKSKLEDDFKKNVWHIGYEKNPHPAPFNLRIADNIVRACCPENGIVYDPFMGSGTTAVAAVNNNRNWIGSEISEEYCKMADERITDAYKNNGEYECFFNK